MNHSQLPMPLHSPSAGLYRQATQPGGADHSITYGIPGFPVLTGVVMPLWWSWPGCFLQISSSGSGTARRGIGTPVRASENAPADRLRVKSACHRRKQGFSGGY